MLRAHMGAELFRRAFEAGDIDAVMEDLAEGFAFYHAAASEPTTDRAPMHRIFAVARETMGDDFRFTEHLQGDGLHALRWTTTVDGIPAEGVDIVREDADGRMLELRINMRPLPALLAWQEMMGARLGRRH
jgi:hypothetical protein